MNLQPVVGLLLAHAVLGEVIGVWQVAGAAFVLGGVALTTARAGPSGQPRTRLRQLSFLTSARILSGSGNSPLPYRSTKATLPFVSMTNVARLLAFQSCQYTP